MNPTSDRHWGLGLGLAVLWAAVLYLGTMGRHIGMGDTALLLNDIVHLHVNSHVNNHPVAVFLGWLLQFLPFGTPALKGNLLSALLGVAAMGMLYPVAYHWLRRAPLALIATMFTSVIHTVWWHSTIVENYMVNAVLLLAVVRLMQKNAAESGPKHLYAAAALGGLAFVNHTQMGFLAPALGLTLLLKPGFVARTRAVEVAKLAGAWWIGMVPFLGLLLRDLINQNWNTRVLYWTIGGDFTERMFDLKAHSLGTLISTEALIQLPSVLLPLAIWGLWSIRRRRDEWPMHGGLALGFAINTAFFLQFHTWDRFAFLMPSYLIIALWAMVGWAELFDRFPSVKAQRGLVLLGLSAVVTPPVLTLNMVEWARNPGFWHRRYATSATWNSHDVGQYVGTPAKQNWDDMHRMAMAIHAHVPNGSAIIDDDSRSHYPLQMYYQGLMGLRKDLKLIVINSWGFGGWGHTSEQLNQLCTRRIAAGEECFYVTTHFPMVESLGLLIDGGHRVERFDLDDDHWLYRVVKGPGTQLPVRVLELETGSVFNAIPSVLTHRFGPDEPVRARLRVIREEELEPVEVAFTWTAPDGSETETVGTVEAKRPGAVSQLPEDRVQQGAWTVGAAIGDEVVGRATFRVEDAPARRRSVTGG